MIYKVKSATAKTTSTGKPMKALELVDTEGLEHKVNIFSDFPDYANLNVGSEINGELKQNDKGYTNLYSNNVPQKKPNMERVMEKKADMISMSQEKKAQNIAQAQDRSAWMWAKVNASNLLAHGKADALKIRDLDEVAEMVLDLATKIYNGEPTEPFTS